MSSDPGPAGKFSVLTSEPQTCAGVKCPMVTVVWSGVITSGLAAG